MIKIFPYKAGSESAKALALALNAKIIKLKNSKFKWKDNQSVINWGNSKPLGKCLNQDTTIATHKLKAFNAFKKHGVSAPLYTTSKKEALEWCKKGTVLGRQLLRGNSGKGIFILNTENERVGKLYTLYVKKHREFRVHVINGTVERIQEKLLRKGSPPSLIRSYDNGYVFCEPKCMPPDTVLSNAIAAVKACGLDFGAVDVIYNDKQERAYVLEVNTAPGISTHTAEIYANAFRKHYGI